MEVKHWTHPANTVEITDGEEDSKQNIYGGSKGEHGVGYGIAIFTVSNITDTKNTDQTGDVRITNPNN
jgi:hypothetical protein